MYLPGMVAAGLFTAVSAGLTVYPYLIYPLLLRRLKSRPLNLQPDEPIPAMTLVFAAHNEATVIAEKLANCLTLQQQAQAAGGRLDVVLYLDACTDATAAIAASFPSIKVIDSPVRQGKNGGLNTIVPGLQTPLVLFTDANVMIDPNAPMALARVFADAAVGVACGHLRYVNSTESTTAATGSLYWRLEEYIKGEESRINSTPGADGSLFAMRTSLFRQVPADAPNDFYSAMDVLCPDAERPAYRVVRVADAMAYEKVSEKSTDEFRRKVRIATRAVTAHLHLWPRIRRLPSGDLFMYLSHRVIRWLGIYWVGLTVLGFLLFGLSAGLFLPALALVMVGLLTFLSGARLGLKPLPMLWDMLLSFAATGQGVARAVRGRRVSVWHVAASSR